MTGLTPVERFQILGLILVANGISVGFVWAAWAVTKAERAGKEPTAAGGWAFFALLLPLLFIGFSGYLGMIAE